MKLVKWFRRNRKVAFAALTLMAMISFVILPIILDMLHGTNPRNPVVVKTTKYGSLHQNDVALLVQQRRKVMAFLEQVAMVTAKGQPRYAQTEAIRALQQLGPADEEDVVNTWLLTNRAKQLGFQATDETVLAFIRQVGEKKLTDKNLQEIRRQLQISEGELATYVGNELLAMRLRETFLRSLMGMPPGQMWDYFLRMNRKAEIEAAPIQVDDFLDRVGEPSEKEVKALFEKYKNKSHDPNSPEPGFRIPHRVSIEYLRADYDKLADPQSVSEADNKKYYEENKDFEFVEREEAPPKAEPPKPVPPKTEAPKAEPPKATPSKPEGPPVKSEPAKPAEPAKPDPAKPEPAKPVAAKPEPSKPAPAPEAGKKPDSKAPPAPAKEPAKPAPAKEPAKTSSAARSPFRFASFQEKEKPSAPAKADQPPPKPEPAAAKPQSALAKPESKTESKPEAKPAPASAKPEAAPAKPVTKPEKPPTKYKPLDQVKDDIRRTLARRQAEQKADSLLRQLQDELQQYEYKWLSYDQETGKGQMPPERPDFKALARKYGLVSNETGLVPEWKIDQFDIALSQLEGRRPFAEVAFGPLNLFRPLISKGANGNSSYLFWKIEDDPEAEPNLAKPEVRQRVVEAWKLQKARGEAKDRAEQLAEEARKAGSPLQQSLGGQSGRKVIRPEPFSWLTVRLLPNQFAAVTNQVSMIPSAGEEFMQSVFSLEPGQVGAAMNQPQTEAYVVRLDRYTPSTDELWSDFIKGGVNTYMISAVAQQEFIKTRQAWIKGIQDEAGLQWLQEPRRRTDTR